MASFFDWLGASLLVAAAAMYLLRLRHERPALAPYLLVALASLVGRLLGEGHPPVAIGLLIAGAFLLLHIASLPYPDEGEDAGQ
ncbi:MAG: XrtV sorting system accessory protein [Amphiplicatus sp.]